MSGPWEKYQSQTVTSGPWEKYGSQEAISTKTDTQKVKPIGMSEKVLRGVIDPIEGAAQLLYNAMPESVQQAGNTINNWLAKNTGIVPEIPKTGLNALISQQENLYQSRRGNDAGIDTARLIGNVISPANLVIASKLPLAATLTGKIAQGAGMGAIGGALQPVTEGEYGPEKTQQVGIGAITGSVLTPAVSKLGSIIAHRLAPIIGKTETGGAMASIQADKVINDALNEVKQRADEIHPAVLQSLRQQVVESLKSGKTPDAAAMLRKADFDALNMPSTLGQITREPLQFAKEKNLRGVLGIGEPIMERLDRQNQILQGRVGEMAKGAQESYPAGMQISEALKAKDEALRKNVSTLYEKARESAGKDLDVPLQGLAQDYASVLDSFGDKVPSGVRNQFKALGMEGGKQLKTFTIADADKLLKVINDNVGNDVATNRALSNLRQSVKNAVIASDATGGPFAPAVKAASERFRMHEAIPSLEAAANGTVAPDDFVRKFIINGKTSDVKGMAGVLSNQSPEAFQQAKSQIGAVLQRAAFGENTALDKQFAPERFSKALRDIGTEKLSAFFSPQEIADMKTMARVAAYIGSSPGSAPVNFSNTAAAMTLLKRIPGVPAAVGAADFARNAISSGKAVQNALAANIPTSRTPLTQEQINMLARIAGGAGLIGGGFAAGEDR